jgi:sulfite exporter TauE/SafE
MEAWLALLGGSSAWLAGVLLGLSAAVHCLGMCGPLVIALGKTRSHWLALAAYHGARTGSYLLLGLVVMTFAPMATGQRWLSILSGAFLLATAWQEQFSEPACCTTQKTPWHQRLLRWRLWSLNNTSGALTASVLGGLNGLLPCGMVYAALASSTAFGGWTGGVQFLMGFGAATALPLIALQALGKHLPSHWMRRWKTASAMLGLAMGLWYIMRGAGLGIPFLSPSDVSLQLESHAPVPPAAAATKNPTNHPTDHPKPVPLSPIPREKPGACCTKE